MKRYSIILITLLSSTLFGQTNWYVDYQNGNNSNNGTSVSTAVKTVGQLTSNNLLQPSDIVFIIGEYHNPSYNPTFSYNGNSDRNNPHIWHSENTIKLNNLNGAENQYITFKPYDNTTVLKGDGANIFRISNSSYIRIEGFEIYGEVENIPVSTAEGLITDGLQFLYLDPSTVDKKNPALSEVLYRVTVGTATTTIENTTYPILGNVTRPSYTDTRGLYVTGSNHINIINNEIHHTPGGGLRISESSYVNIYENEIHNCSKRSFSGTHALVVTKAIGGIANSTDDTTYNIKIQRNLIRYNYNEVWSWAPTKDLIAPRIDEGKGISLQRNNLSDWENGNKRILVENNLCYWNGFSGVHSNDGYHIDFINNTCFMNSFTNTVTYAGSDQKGNNIGISTSNGSDIKIINNVSVIDTDWNGFAISTNGGTTNLVIENNLIYGTNGTVNQDADVTAIETNTTIADPNFVTTTSFDFNLQSTSPAIGLADVNNSPTIDFFGNSRDNNPDLGAIEYITTLSINEFSLDNNNIYPNPFINELTIYNTNMSVEEVRVYGLLGQDLTNDVSIKKIDQNIKIETSNLPKGMYIIKTETFANKVYKK